MKSTINGGEQAFHGLPKLNGLAPKRANSASVRRRKTNNPSLEGLLSCRHEELAIDGVRAPRATQAVLEPGAIIYTLKVPTRWAHVPRAVHDRDVPQSSAAASARPARPKVPGFFCMEGYRGNSRGFSQLWEDTVTSVTMALARLVDRQRAGVKSFLPVCHKAEWPSSSIRCDPLLFRLSSRLCFLVFLSFQCLKTILKIEKGKRYDFLEWPRLSIDEAWKWLSSSARTYFDLKMEKIPRTQYCWAVGLVLFGVDNFSTRTCSKRRGKV